MKLVVAAALLAAALADGPPDVGVVEHKRPTKDDIKLPKPDDKTPTVELQSEVKGKAKAGEKRTLYIVVGPMSKDGKVTDWWVQGETSKDGDAFTASAQFGEDSAGVGEYFVILGVAAEKSWTPGEKMSELPADAGYSKPKVVKRSK